MDFISLNSHFEPFKLDDEWFCYLYEHRKPSKKYKIFVGTKVRPVFKFYSKYEEGRKGEGVITRSIGYP